MDERFSRQCPNSRLLVLLLEEGRILRSSVQKIHGFDYRAAKSAFEYLERSDLVIYEAVGDRRDTVYWSLTDKGMRVAHMLVEVDNLIKNR